MNKVSLGFLLLCLLTLAYAEDLITQYREALHFALYREGPSEDYESARTWAREFLENKAVLSAEKTIYQHYREAFELAISARGLRMEIEDARQWAKNLILTRHRNWGIKNLAAELEEFLNNMSLEDSEVSRWCLLFLDSPNPFYSTMSLRDRYEEIFQFLRRRPEFSCSLEEAEEAALKFVEQRYFFAPDRPLLRQYTEAYEFAVAVQKLNHEEGHNWAVQFVIERGSPPAYESLSFQYREAYQFATMSPGLALPHEEATNWAILYLERKGHLPVDQPLLNQYSEAYLFAYTGDFLYPYRSEESGPSYVLLPEDFAGCIAAVMGSSMNIGSRNVFLHDEAAGWARMFVTARGVLPTNLRDGYREALLFAYSSKGLCLDREQAEEWAYNFIERPLME